MKYIRIVVFMLLLAFSRFLTGCYSRDETIYTNSYKYFDDFFPSKGINLELLTLNAQNIVREKFPEAQYGSFIYKGDCRELRDFRGTYLFHFVQTNYRYFGLNPEVLFIDVIYDNKNHTLTMDYQDVTDDYPNTNLYTVVDTTVFKNIVNMVEKEIDIPINHVCNVTISQLDTSWGVLCNDAKVCNFEIDSKTLDIVDRESRK